MSTSAFEIFHARPYGAALRACGPMAQAQTLADLSDCDVHARATIYTIDMGGGRHIDGAGVRYLNHSCAPNVFVDCARMQIRTLRPIEVGEELTFFYPSTEWDMVGPFDCLCGAPECIGVVSGASQLPQAVLDRYELNAHIAARLTPTVPAVSS